MNQFLKSWEYATERMANHFMSKYFKDPDYYWIGDKIGEVLSVNDYFFDLNDIADFLRYNYSIDQMFAYEDYRTGIEQRRLGKKPPHQEEILSIKSWKKLNDFAKKSRFKR